MDLQAQIKQKSCITEFIQCSTHILNLVCTFATELTSIENNFFFDCLKPTCFFLRLPQDVILYQKN